jgi:hypothetical protein
MANQPGFWQMVMSVLAAFFGVQSEHNRQRDFSSGRGWSYFALAILLAALFIVFVSLMVLFALNLADS